ncbi:tetratricopeptide repeat protein, partial [Proteiniclasticum ruminis]|uniref:tetratricopeptide repeat protein n=1 Tax=Proteiniclasticum ruminis TaxID=398199 RepID=UPI0028B19F13
EYKNSIMYEILGYLYIAAGDYEKALSFNKEAYEYNKDDYVITDNLAQSYFFLGDLEKAEALYEKSIDYIKFPEAHYYYGQILQKKGDYLGAHDALKRALRLKMSFLSIITREDIEEKLLALQQEMEEKNLTVESLEEEKKRQEEEAKLLEEKVTEEEEEKETSEYKVD